MLQCPKCGVSSPPGTHACARCGQSLNGAPRSAEDGPNERMAELAPNPSGILSPQLVEMLKQQFDEAEFVAGLNEINETGGLELKDFIKELEEEAQPRE